MEGLQEKLERMSNPNIIIFENILSKMKTTYIKKNSDYGDSFTKSCNEFGLTAPIVRMFDKLNRIKTLSKNQSSMKIEDEKIEDTLLDLANYAVMTLVWMKNHEL